MFNADHFNVNYMSLVFILLDHFLSSDLIQTHLRNQLIQELQHPPLTGGEPVPRLVPVKSETLLVSACNSIVADHLRNSGYEYTLSVFYPESGLHKDRVSMASACILFTVAWSINDMIANRQIGLWSILSGFQERRPSSAS